MRIAGEWLRWTDAIVRPMIECKVAGADGQSHTDFFLLDTGADRTVFGADFLQLLQLPASPGSVPSRLQGVGGNSNSIEVDAVLELKKSDGNWVSVKGKYAAFTDPAASDYSILGRDVLDLFDLIVSRPRDEILLLSGNHSYQVHPPATP